MEPVILDISHTSGTEPQYTCSSGGVVCASDGFESFTFNLLGRLRLDTHYSLPTMEDAGLDSIDFFKQPLNREIKIKDVLVLDIEIQDALTGTDKILEELKKQNLKDKILILKLKGFQGFPLFFLHVLLLQKLCKHKSFQSHPNHTSEIAPC